MKHNTDYLRGDLKGINIAIDGIENLNPCRSVALSVEDFGLIYEILIKAKKRISRKIKEVEDENKR